MKQPTEYSVEFTNRYRLQYGALPIIAYYKGKRREKKQDKRKNNPKTQKLGSYQGRDQKYYYNIVATGLIHPGAKKGFM